MAKKKNKKRKNNYPGVIGSTFPEDFDPLDVEKRIIAVKDEPVHARILLYGNPGTEKTRFIASACKEVNPLTGEKFRVLIADCNEKGTLSVRKFDPTGKYLKVMRIRGSLDIEQLFWYLMTNPKKFDIVGLDTLTELQYSFLRGAIDEDAQENVRDILMPHKRDYGKSAELMRLWINNYSNLPMHVILSSHELREDDEDEESGRWPDLQRAVKNRVPGMVDIIGRAYHREIKDKTTPCIFFGAHETWLTKDRSGCLPKEMKNPTLGKIISLIQGSDELREAQGKTKKSKDKKRRK